MKKIYHRKKDIYYDEIQYKDKMLTFLYKTKIGRFLLANIIIKRWFSKLISGSYYSSKSISKIQDFIETYKIPMEEYKVSSYESFNDFFIREIKKEFRPFDMMPNKLVSPADAKLLYVPIRRKTVYKVKEVSYSLSSILDSKDLAENYFDGDMFIFRLTVDDYHRYNFFDDGEVVSTKDIDGILHTVGPFSNGIPIFKENHRIISVLKTVNFGKVIMIEVGALQVGKITNHPVKRFKRGQEKGFFSYGGSTIILIFAKDVLKIDRDIFEHSRKDIEVAVKQGESIAKSLRA